MSDLDYDAGEPASELEDVIEAHNYDTGWRCECGFEGTFSEHNKHLADAIRAFLAHQPIGDQP